VYCVWTKIDVEVPTSLKRELTIRDDDPLSARYVLTQSYELMGREGWRTVIDTRAEMLQRSEQLLPVRRR
jgi:uncharacterized protein